MEEYRAANPMQLVEAVDALNRAGAVPHEDNTVSIGMLCGSESSIALLATADPNAMPSDCAAEAVAHAAKLGWETGAPFLVCTTRTLPSETEEERDAIREAGAALNRRVEDLSFAFACMGFALLDVIGVKRFRADGPDSIRSDAVSSLCLDCGVAAAIDAFPGHREMREKTRAADKGASLC